MLTELKSHEISFIMIVLDWEFQSISHCNVFDFRSCTVLAIILYVFLQLFIIHHFINSRLESVIESCLIDCKWWKQSTLSWLYCEMASLSPIPYLLLIQHVGTAWLFPTEVFFLVSLSFIYLFFCFLFLRFSPTYKKVVFREYEKDFKQAKVHDPSLGNILYIPVIVSI